MLSMCLIKHHVTDVWRTAGITPHILTLDTRWRWAVRFTLWPIFPRGKSSRYLLDRRLGWLQSKSLSLEGIEPRLTNP